MVTKNAFTLENPFSMEPATEIEPPKILYKYISWSDKPRDKRKNILLKNILHFSNPFYFNDPFDSMLPVVFHEDYRNSEKFHMDFLIINHVLGKTNYTFEQMKIMAKDRYENPHKVRYDVKVMTETIQRLTLELVRISCFTTKKDNILMWSHYADCHRGICIGFNTDYLQNRDLIMYAKVNYAKQFPKLKQVVNSPLLFTKSLDWKYENEYRMINLKSLEQIGFPKEAVIEIIIGYKMNEQKRNQLIDQMSRRYPGVCISVSKPNAARFKMDIKPI